MTWVVFLDTGVLGLVTHPKGSADATRCTTWLKDLLSHGHQVCIPEVCDYELRRDYVRRAPHDGAAQKALVKLDALKEVIDYIPIRTDMMVHAAALWAQAKNRGKTTAHPEQLDVDVILAAQALIIAAENKLTIATTNVGHLSQFADSRTYRDIPPV